MIETWLNLFGLLSGAFLLIDFSYKHLLYTEIKWIKETGLDISAGSRAEDNGPQENPRRPNCQQLKRTEGATRQKAFSMDLSLDLR